MMMMMVDESNNCGDEDWRYIWYMMTMIQSNWMMMTRLGGGRWRTRKKLTITNGSSDHIMSDIYSFFSFFVFIFFVVFLFDFFFTLCLQTTLISFISIIFIMNDSITQWRWSNILSTKKNCEKVLFVCVITYRHDALFDGLYIFPIVVWILLCNCCQVLNVNQRVEPEALQGIQIIVHDFSVKCIVVVVAHFFIDVVVVMVSKCCCCCCCWWWRRNIHKVFCDDCWFVDDDCVVGVFFRLCASRFCKNRWVVM